VRVFVTGGTGFVGSRLAEVLLERGNEVVCLVRNTAKLQRRFPHNPPDVVQGDLADRDALRKGCDGAQIVFHSAGLTAARDRSEFFAVNVDGTRRVAEAAAEVAPDLQRFVYIGSQAAAGPSSRGTPKTESDPTEPVSDYGRSKLAGEKAAQECGLPWTVLRPSSVYGPRDTAFLTVFKSARLGIVPAFGDGKQELSLVHVDDLVEAMVCALSPTGASKTYFVCHPEVTDATEFARAVYLAVKGHEVESTARPTIVHLPAWVARGALRVTGAAARLAGKATMLSPDKASEFLADAWTCSPAALRNDTGWEANISLNDGVRHTARWYEEHGWL
jgi:nucleoside-diphosphate-sugar epimerase